MTASTQIRLPLVPALSGRWCSLIEIVLVFGLFVGFLWGGRDLLPRSSSLFILTMLTLLSVLHWRSHESAFMLGWRLDTFGRALRWLLPPALLVAFGVLSYAWLTGSARFPPWQTALPVFLSFIGSGLLQQYVLLGFFGRRFARVCSAPQLAVLATASIFALLHLPNTFLTVVTFLAGLWCGAVYRRAPNLLASGLTHGGLSFVLSFGLPLEVNDAMRVGIHHIAL